MRCDKCNKKVERAYLVNGKLLCWLDAEEETRATKKMINHAPEKGSNEAKEKMANARSMKSKRPGIQAFVFSMLDQDPKTTPEKLLTMVLDKFPGAKTDRKHVVWFKFLHTRAQA